MGLIDSLVGRTRFCIHPADVIDRVPRFGGTKNPKMDRIRATQPTHILFNREENDVSQLPEIEKIAKTVITTPTDIDSTLEMIATFGRVFETVETATDWIKRIQTKRDRMAQKSWSAFSYLYLIWRNPWMAAGADTYIDHMLTQIGGQNAVTEIGSERYPKLEMKQIHDLDVDVIFLSSEPYPFKNAHRAEFGDMAARARDIDGEACSWHGTATLSGLEYLERLASDLNLQR